MLIIGNISKDIKLMNSKRDIDTININSMRFHITPKHAWGHKSGPLLLSYQSNKSSYYIMLSHGSKCVRLVHTSFLFIALTWPHAC